MKKPLLTCLLAVFMLLGACHHVRCAEPMRILATTFPVWQFTANICAKAPNVVVELLIPASAGCPHDFSLKPADLNKLAQADIIVTNGAGLEEFLTRPLDGLKKKPAIINASQNVPVLEEAHGDHGHANPHTFASPANAALMATNIAAGIAEKDPRNAQLYNENGNAYVKRLTEISDKLKKIGGQAPNPSIALEHDALAYLAKNADLKIAAIFENTASASQLAKLRQQLATEKPALLAGDAQYPDRLLRVLSQETHIPFAQLNPCASGPADAPLDYYEKVMQSNWDILEKFFAKH